MISKKVYQYDFNFNLIKTFATINEASFKLKIPKKLVSSYAKFNTRDIYTKILSFKEIKNKNKKSYYVLYKHSENDSEKEIVFISKFKEEIINELDKIHFTDLEKEQLTIYNITFWRKNNFSIEKVSF